MIVVQSKPFLSPPLAVEPELSVPTSMFFYSTGILERYVLYKHRWQTTLASLYTNGSRDGCTFATVSNPDYLYHLPTTSRSSLLLNRQVQDYLIVAMTGAVVHLRFVKPIPKHLSSLHTL